VLTTAPTRTIAGWLLPTPSIYRIPARCALKPPGREDAFKTIDDFDFTLQTTARLSLLGQQRDALFHGVAELKVIRSWIMLS